MDDLMPYGTQILSIGAGPGGSESAPLRADPRRESVAVGFLGAMGGELPATEGHRCGPYGWHSLEKYERMGETPVVSSSFDAIRTGCLSGGVSLLSAIKPKAGKPAEGQVDGDEVEAEMAAQIAASNSRTLHAWKTPLPAVLWEGMESLKFGHKLGERVYGYVEGGPDAGLLAIESVKWKPRRNYRFVVDHANNVRSIRALALAEKDRLQWRDFSPEHFCWLTWDPYCGDPRGRSMLRTAVRDWDRLEELWPEVMKGWKQFGTPMIFATTSENATPVPPTDAYGVAIPGKLPISPETDLALTIHRLKNGDGVAAKFGATMKVIESAKDSTIVSGAITILEGLIIRAILLQLRATTEAQHGSKADSQTGQDIMGTLVRFIRMWLERFIRNLLMEQNALNYGPDIARRLTPLVTLGDHEHQDLAQFGAIIAQLHQASYFGQSQYASLDTTLGVAQRIPGEPRVGPDGLVYDTNPDPAIVAEQQAAAEPEPEAEAETEQGVAA